MQTFLPFSDFQKSAQVLDTRRCWKQVIESRQILNAIKSDNPKVGWKSHPATKMWVGYVDALSAYSNTFYYESLKRGIKIKAYVPLQLECPVIYPPWLGNEQFHSSHRLALLCKNPEFYSQFGWPEHPTSDLSYYYIWPV